MIICPNCHHENPVSEDICEECGLPLEDADALDAPDASGAKSPTVDCPNCGKSLPDGAAFCDACGYKIAGPDPGPSADPDPVLTPIPEPDVDWQSSSDPDVDIAPLLPPDSDPAPSSPQTPSPTRQWRLRVVEGLHVNKEILLIKDEMLVGRMDEDDGVYPDIDLEGQDEGYVSRRHAIVRIRDGQVYVEDLGGANGTRIDNKPIEPNEETPVADKQVIRVGKVGLMLESA